MTRKDYRTLAAVLASTKPDHTPGVGDHHGIVPGKYGQWRATVVAIADALATDSGYDLNGNRLFDRDRFYAAAGMTS